MLVVVTGPRGGKVNERLGAYTKVAVKFFADRLGILSAPVRVHVRLHKQIYTADTDGYTVEDNKRKYVLDVCMFNDWLTTLAHEMVHVKQFINDELTHDVIAASSSGTHEEYMNAPHEMEAYTVQHELVKAFTSVVHAFNL